MLEAVSTSEKLVSFYGTMQYNIPEDSNINLKTYCEEINNYKHSNDAKL